MFKSAKFSENRCVSTNEFTYTFFIAFYNLSLFPNLGPFHFLVGLQFNPQTIFSIHSSSINPPCALSTIHSGINCSFNFPHNFRSQVPTFSTPHPFMCNKWTFNPVICLRLSEPRFPPPPIHYRKKKLKFSTLSCARVGNLEGWNCHIFSPKIYRPALCRFRFVRVISNEIWNTVRFSHRWWKFNSLLSALILK